MSRAARRARATLELELEPEAPAGALSAGDGRPRRFSGWIELAAAIEEWRAEQRAEEREDGAEHPSTG